MEIVRAELVDVEGLAELNKGLIEDERHPNLMDVAQLTRRMKEWLAGGDVFAHNEDAVAFYKEYGFRIGVYRMEK